MSQVQLLQLSDTIRKNEEKLHQLEKPISQITKEVVNKDIEMIESETSKISKFGNGINSILQKTKIYRVSAEKVVAELNRQVSDLKQKIAVYDKEFNLNNKQKEFKRQIQENEKLYVSDWQKRIQIANDVNIKPFLKLQIQDRKSKAHEVFKWIVVTIYGEPEAKYYLPNFIQQVFERDQGKDFKERLGKINASTAKQEAKIKSTDFLKGYSQIIACPELSSVKSQIEKIRNIAEIFLKCYETSRRIKDLEVSIQKSKDESRQKDQEAMRWKAKSGALQDRIKTNSEYLTVLNKIESKLQGKVESYKEKQGMANEVVARLKRHENIPELDLNIESDKRDVCECRIF